ncbi:hypothetical protein B0H16DRAFT_1706306 [Mycena metata]|uniref:Uncharacterized protein n=1 Tax=Mycena metata TaxID=1033252 RepID=A0AAD7DRZ8_9AGAR|nr:hypothetical protein B0H16DRAFT_1706306 [Mycena metata]
MGRETEAGKESASRASVRCAEKEELHEHNALGTTREQKSCTEREERSISPASQDFRESSARLRPRPSCRARDTGAYGPHPRRTQTSTAAAAAVYARLRRRCILPPPASATRARLCPSNTGGTDTRPPLQISPPSPSSPHRAEQLHKHRPYAEERDEDESPVVPAYTRRRLGSLPVPVTSRWSCFPRTRTRAPRTRRSRLKRTAQTLDDLEERGPHTFPAHGVDPRSRRQPGALAPLLSVHRRAGTNSTARRQHRLLADSTRPAAPDRLTEGPACHSPPRPGRRSSAGGSLGRKTPPVRSACAAAGQHRSPARIRIVRVGVLRARRATFGSISARRGIPQARTTSRPAPDVDDAYSPSYRRGADNAAAVPIHDRRHFAGAGGWRCSASGISAQTGSIQPGAKVEKPSKDGAGGRRKIGKARVNVGRKWEARAQGGRKEGAEQMEREERRTWEKEARRRCAGGRRGCARKSAKGEVMVSDWHEGRRGAKRKCKGCTVQMVEAVRAVQG